MASSFLDTILLRHGPRWHPMAKNALASDTYNWQASYYPGIIPTPMGVWGQKPPTETRVSKSVIGSHNSTNSWPNMPTASTPSPSKPQGTKSSKLGSFWEPVKTGTDNMLFRPTIRRQTQVTGRFFPKPSLTDQERVLLAAKTGRPLSGSFLMSNKYHEIKKLANKIGNAASSSDRPTRPMSSCNPKIAATRRTLFDHQENMAKSEVFMISFRDENKRVYDPNSELHSDYYTVKRQVRFSPVRQVSVPTKEAVFADMVRGKSKRMHSRG